MPRLGVGATTSVSSDINDWRAPTLRMQLARRETNTRKPRRFSSLLDRTARHAGAGFGLEQDKKYLGFECIIIPNPARPLVPTFPKARHGHLHRFSNRMTRRNQTGALMRILQVCLMLMPLTAMAQWQHYGTSSGIMLYADLDSRQRNGPQVTMWTLQNYSDKTERLSYKSQRLRAEYDCAQRTVRVMEWYGYSEWFAGGREVLHWNKPWDKMEVPPAPSVGWAEFVVACGSTISPSPSSEDEETPLASMPLKSNGGFIDAGTRKNQRGSGPLPGRAAAIASRSLLNSVVDLLDM